MSHIKTLTNGIFRENPTFGLVLGMCPTLATTTSAANGMGMGAATTFVLVMSNLVISLVANLIPDKIRIPAFIVIIAAFVTIVDFAMQAYTQSLYEALGLFIPLIVVNCIVLGRAEAFASKNGPILSMLDGRLHAEPHDTGLHSRISRQRKNLRHDHHARTIRHAGIRARTGRFPCFGVADGNSKPLEKK